MGLLLQRTRGYFPESTLSGLQLLVTPVPGHLNLFLGSFGSAHMCTYTCEDTHMYIELKIKSKTLHNTIYNI